MTPLIQYIPYEVVQAEETRSRSYFFTEKLADIN